MTRLATTLIALGALAATGIASAQYRGYDDGRYDYAEVVRVDPIIERISEPVSRDVCWDEPVTYREPTYVREDRGSRAGVVLGTIIGGVIGNQFGSGRGRDAATVAGAALGHAVARDSQRYNGRTYVSGGREVTRYEQRCDVQTDYIDEERVVGYDVTYRYNGQTYRTRTPDHPGRRIQVRVDVQPVG